MHRTVLPALALLAACGSHAQPQPPSPPPSWPVPDGWKHEAIPFPLDFAPSIEHRGVEELRFPPGFLAKDAANRWSYVFVWRLDDAAPLDAAQLATELTAYFRGLLIAVDGEQHRVADPAEIIAAAAATGDGFALTAHVLDTFGDAGPVELDGTARRTACGGGALWTFVLAPPASPIRAELDALAAIAACDQPPLANPPSPAAAR